MVDSYVLSSNHLDVNPSALSTYIVTTYVL
jgi:hypothetical protein